MFQNRVVSLRGVSTVISVGDLFVFQHDHVKDVAPTSVLLLRTKITAIVVLNHLPTVTLIQFIRYSDQSLQIHKSLSNFSPSEIRE